MLSKKITKEHATRIAAKYESRLLKLVPDGCWTVTGIKLTEKGYLRVKDLLLGHVRLHRVFYTAYREEIEEDMTVDHLCLNEACCNPEHLEIVTNEENNKRKELKTHCKWGHPFSPENTSIRHRNGGTERRCKTCHNSYR